MSQRDLFRRRQRRGWRGEGRWQVGPTFTLCPFPRSGAGTDPHCCGRLLRGTAGCSSDLRPDLGCPLEESLPLGPPHEATHRTGSRSSPWFQGAGGQKVPSCQGCGAQGAKSQGVARPPRGCLCAGPSLLPPASFLLVCCLLLPHRCPFFFQTAPISP